jgi:hypothetical protein
LKKSIVITSIFKPTEAVALFSKMHDYQVIVVGDRKTPANWNNRHVDYLSLESQKSLDFELSKTLPYNHYCRKMLGYLKAIESNADYIIDTDDDNIPKDDWGFPLFENTYEYVADNAGFINVYQLFTNRKIWPRGLPLRLISKKFQLETSLTLTNCSIGIWQGLADEDPDVDAIYRLTDDSPCYFNYRPPIVLGIGTFSPFNSQNTIFRKELFSLLYLPTSVTFRFTDILRGLVAQPIMWLNNYHLGFTSATVVQKRNPHDYMKDFISETPMFLNVEKVTDIVSTTISKYDSIEANLYNAYNALCNNKIICDKEMITLTAWLEDIQKIRRN